MSKKTKNIKKEKYSSHAITSNETYVMYRKRAIGRIMKTRGKLAMQLDFEIDWKALVGKTNILQLSEVILDNDDTAAAIGAVIENHKRFIHDVTNSLNLAINIGKTNGVMPKPVKAVRRIMKLRKKEAKAAKRAKHMTGPIRVEGAKQDKVAA